ncbi:uncharacterized protein LOC122258349 [Penaeus japonicus]|uniref:uncharacterized protein LOC122258349 n=1 Tax=Penaeus japonicus TaxID=27405 RepID=UPI001C70EF77|nr:uncharacterized protein LOC122258349 [Penaeus japonicus]
MALNLSTRRGGRSNGENILPGTKFGLKYKSAKRNNSRQVSDAAQHPLCDVTNVWTPASPHLSDDGDYSDDDGVEGSKLEDNANVFSRRNKYRLEISGLIHPDDLVSKGGRGKGRGKGQGRKDGSFKAGDKSTSQDVIQMVRGKHQLLYGLQDSTADSQVLSDPPSYPNNGLPYPSTAQVDDMNGNLPSLRGVCLPSTYLNGGMALCPIHHVVDSQYAPMMPYGTLGTQSQVEIPVMPRDSFAQLPHQEHSSNGHVGLHTGSESKKGPRIHDNIVFRPRLLSDEDNGLCSHLSDFYTGSEEPEIGNRLGTVCHEGSSSCAFPELEGPRQPDTWSCNHFDVPVDSVERRASNGKPKSKRRSRKHPHSCEEGKQSSKDNMTFASTNILDLEGGPDFKPRYFSFGNVNTSGGPNGAAVARHFHASQRMGGGGFEASSCFRDEEAGGRWPGEVLDGKNHRQDLCLSPDRFASQSPIQNGFYDHNHHGETYHTTTQPTRHHDPTTYHTFYPPTHCSVKGPILNDHKQNVDHHPRNDHKRPQNDHINHHTSSTSYDQETLQNFPGENQTQPPPPWEYQESTQKTGHENGTHEQAHENDQVIFSPKLNVTRTEDSYQAGPRSVLRVSLLEGELALDPADWKVAHTFKGFVGRKTKLLARETDDLTCPRPYLATEELLHLYTSP